MFKTRVFRKIEEIPPEDWNRVFPDVVEGYPFFKSLDESRFEQFSFYYLSVYDQGTLVGVAPCFLMNYPLETTMEGFSKRILTAVKKFFPNLFNLRVLVCGVPMGQGRIGLIEPSDRIIPAVVESMEQIAEKEKVSIIAFKDFGLADMKLLDPLQKQGFHKYKNLPSTEMEIRFASFDQYLKTLSRSSRESLKRKFKELDGRVKIDLEISGEVDGTLSEVYALYRQTMEKAVADGGTQFEVLTPEFFKNIPKNMPRETKYFFWRVDKKLVAFALCFVLKDHFVDYYLGFDYSVAYDYHLYFVRFRDLMNWCIDNKIKKYVMGPTGYEPKRRLGFDFVPLYLYVKHRNPWLNRPFKILCHCLKPENFDPVFKEMRKRDSR